MFRASRFTRAALVLAEHNGKALAAGTLSAITAASRFGDPVTVLVAGSGPSLKDVAAEVAAVNSVGRVLISDDSALEKGLAESYSLMAKNVIRSGDFSHVVSPSSNFGKNYIGRLCAELDVAPITDVVDIIDDETFIRPMYAGNALATVKSSDSPKVISIRTTAFDKAPPSDGATASIDEAKVSDVSSGMSEFLSESASVSERPELTSARIVVSGGRGMKSGDNFGMLETLADKLGGGAVGASRAAVDAGFVPNEYQVGQTGKVVAPDLYVAVGISGAIQHLSGMKDSKTIVSINKDPEAPIFQVSDYGLVADLFHAVPELTKKL